MIDVTVNMVCPFRIDTSIEYQMIEAEGEKQICQTGTKERYPLCMGVQCPMYDEEKGCRRVEE